MSPAPIKNAPAGYQDTRNTELFKGVIFTFHAKSPSFTYIFSFFFLDLLIFFLILFLCGFTGLSVAFFSLFASLWGLITGIGGYPYTLNTISIIYQFIM